MGGRREENKLVSSGEGRIIIENLTMIDKDAEVKQPNNGMCYTASSGGLYGRYTCFSCTHSPRE